VPEPGRVAGVLAVLVWLNADEQKTSENVAAKNTEARLIWRPYTLRIAKHSSRLLIASRPGPGRCSCATKPVYPDSAIAFAMKR